MAVIEIAAGRASLARSTQSTQVDGSRKPVGGGMSSTVRRLASLANLTVEDFKVLISLRGRTIKAGSVIDLPDMITCNPSLILSGWCARVSPTIGERFQITGVLLPGDGFGLGSAPWAGDQLSVMALTSCVLLDATPVHALIRLRSPAHSRLIEACHRLAWLEQTYALNHIVRLAGCSAYQRVAHFIVELYERMRNVEMVRSGAFAMPLAQSIVAEVLGLSEVHLNRVTRTLKREGLVDFPRGHFHIRDLPRLVEVAEFRARSAKVVTTKLPPAESLAGYEISLKQSTSLRQSPVLPETSDALAG